MKEMKSLSVAESLVLIKTMVLSVSVSKKMGQQGQETKRYLFYYKPLSMVSVDLSRKKHLVDANRYHREKL